MTTSPSGPARSGSPSRSTRLRLAAGLIVVVLVALAASGAWYLFLRPAGPAPVDLNALPAASAAPAASASAGAAATAPGTAAATSSGSTSAPGAVSGATAGSASSVGSGSLDGTWRVDTSIGSGATGSFVGYRVQEQLASIGANTAVGRTSSVSGSLDLKGSTITAASFTADLTTLQSDSQMRDGQLTHRGLETSTYPTATFVLTSPIELGSIAAEGQIIKANATGKLTLHGQTRPVTIPLEARRANGVIAVTGSMPIVFADYGIVPPTSFMALSVADHGIMELQLMFRHA